MRLFNKNKKQNASPPVVQTASRENNHPFLEIDRYTPLMSGEYQLYSALREAVPVIDAALDKIVRLVGRFSIECGSKHLEKDINLFLQTVRSGA